MCFICGAACKLIRWVIGLAFLVVVVGALLLGAYVLGPLVNKNSKSSSTAPSVYEYYTEGGITEGLKAEKDDFTLNKKPISLFSGSIHYFRVHPDYWRDRLRKLRAAGFVAVETYVPWNLHEPYKGVFDFGDGGEDMSPFLDIRTFLKIAQEEDLLAILRPGPYICGEWEFGGLPSWLLKEPNIQVRTSDSAFMDHVRLYFERLLPILKNLQFTTKQGPIIAFQVENEYGNTKSKDRDTDKEYLKAIKNLYTEAGLEELFFTSDTPTKGRDYGAIEGVLQTANFNEKATNELNTLKSLQPNKPAMVMEFWTGWFDHWGESHHGMKLEDFKSVLEDILKFPSGVNFYMFHGGTSFGFLNGGNVYKQYPYFLPDISSYDYDAPLSEDGDYTEKYTATSELLEKYQKVKLRKPDRPNETKKTDFGPLKSTGYLDWDTLLSQVGHQDIVSDTALTYMENLSINQGSGQNFGYIVYRKRDVKVGANSNLEIIGKINGAAMVVVDNKLLSPPLKSIEDMYTFGYWCTEEKNNTLDLQVKTDSSVTVDIIVENWSRNNYGKLANDDFKQFRGLSATNGNQIKINGKDNLDTFSIYPLQFKGKWVQSLNAVQGWKEYKNDIKGPVMIRFELEVSEPADTFLDMQEWGKGIVFVNGFNIGRYSTIGPVHSLFVPSPLLKSGKNQIYVFEHFTPATQLKFSKKIIFKDADKTFNVDL